MAGGPKVIGCREEDCVVDQARMVVIHTFCSEDGD